MTEITDRLKKLELHSYIPNSSDHDFIIKFMKTLNPSVDIAIEIGTMNGLSSVAIAQVAKKVYTFDINLRNAEYVWKLFNVRDKINMFVGKDSEAIKEEIHNRLILKRNLEVARGTLPNFAFIDGGHFKEHVIYDFEMVKFCGRVLFHDTDHHPYIGEFVKSIGGKLIHLNFGYWEK